MIRNIRDKIVIHTGNQVKQTKPSMWDSILRHKPPTIKYVDGPALCYEDFKKFNKL